MHCYSMGMCSSDLLVNEWLVSFESCLFCKIAHLLLACTRTFSYRQFIRTELHSAALTDLSDKERTRERERKRSWLTFPTKFIQIHYKFTNILMYSCYLWMTWVCNVVAFWVIVIHILNHSKHTSNHNCLDIYYQHIAWVMPELLVSFGTRQN